MSTMPLARPARIDDGPDDAALREVEQRVLWLASAIVDRHHGIDTDSVVGAALDLL